MIKIIKYIKNKNPYSRNKKIPFKFISFAKKNKNIDGIKILINDGRGIKVLNFL